MRSISSPSPLYDPQCWNAAYMIDLSTSLDMMLKGYIIRKSTQRSNGVCHKPTPGVQLAGSDLSKQRLGECQNSSIREHLYNVIQLLVPPPIVVSITYRSNLVSAM